jgi:hypothetical protein
MCTLKVLLLLHRDRAYIPFIHSQYFVLLRAEWPYSLKYSQKMLNTVFMTSDYLDTKCLILMKPAMQAEVETNV